MELHEIKKIEMNSTDLHLTIQKVPGGFNYIYENCVTYSISVVFVPEEKNIKIKN